MIDDSNYKIELDLDRDRIKFVLKEAYRTCQDMLSIDFDMSLDTFVSQINKFLESNRVSLPVSLPLPSKKYPDLHIEIDLRQKSVIARMSNRKKRIYINRFLTKL